MNAMNNENKLQAKRGLPNLPDRFVKRMTELGIEGPYSVRRMATLCNVPASTVSDLLNGKGQMRLFDAAKIALNFKWSFEEVHENFYGENIWTRVSEARTLSPMSDDESVMQDKASGRVRSKKLKGILLGRILRQCRAS